DRTTFAEIGPFKIGGHAARNAGEKHLGVFRGRGGVRDGLTYGLASERESGLADLLLAFRKMEIERTPRRAASRQDVVQGRPVITLLAKQTGCGGQRFPFGISSFCHAKKYHLQISMSTFIICRMAYILILIAALAALPLQSRAQPDRIPISIEEKAMTGLTEE